MSNHIRLIDLLGEVIGPNWRQSRYAERAKVLFSTRQLDREQVRGPGDKSGHGVAKDGAIAQPSQQQGADAGPQSTSAPIQGTDTQPKSGEPSKKEDEFTQDIADLDAGEKLNPETSLGAMVAKIFDQPTGGDEAEEEEKKGEEEESGEGEVEKEGFNLGRNPSKLRRQPKGTGVGWKKGGKRMSPTTTPSRMKEATTRDTKPSKDIRKTADEKKNIKNGMLYRSGNVIQVWWKKDTLGRPMPKGKEAETWTHPDEHSARAGFKDMASSWNESLDESDPWLLGPVNSDLWREAHAYLRKDVIGEAGRVRGIKNNPTPDFVTSITGIKVDVNGLAKFLKTKISASVRKDMLRMYIKEYGGVVVRRIIDHYEKLTENKSVDLWREVIDSLPEEYKGDEQVVTDADGNAIDIDEDEFRTAQKTEPTDVVQIDEPFNVETKEGPAKGDAGDYLAKGVDGEMWPIDQEIFEKTHEFVDEVKGLAAPDFETWVEVDEEAVGAFSMRAAAVKKGQRDPAFKHQLKIARDTLKMNPVMARIMGGMNHEEARAFLKRSGLSERWIPPHRRGGPSQVKFKKTSSRGSVTKYEGVTPKGTVFMFHPTDRTRAHTHGTAYGLTKYTEWVTYRMKEGKVDSSWGPVKSRDMRGAKKTIEDAARRESTTEGYAGEKRSLKRTTGSKEWGKTRKSTRSGVKNRRDTRKAERRRGKQQTQQEGSEMMWFRNPGTKGPLNPNTHIPYHPAMDHPELREKVAAIAKQAMSISEVRQVRPDLYAAKNQVGEVRHFSSKKMAKLFAESIGRSWLADASLSHGSGTSTPSDRHGTGSLVTKSELTPEEMKVIDSNNKQIQAFAKKAFQSEPYPIALRAIEAYLERLGVDNKHVGKISDMLAKSFGMDDDPISMIIPKVLPRITQEPSVKGGGHFFGGHPGMHQGGV